MFANAHQQFVVTDDKYFGRLLANLNGVNCKKFYKHYDVIFAQISLLFDV